MVMLVRAKTTTPLELDVVDSPVSTAADRSPCHPASRALAWNSPKRASTTRVSCARRTEPWYSDKYSKSGPYEPALTVLMQQRFADPVPVDGGPSAALHGAINAGCPQPPGPEDLGAELPARGPLPGAETFRVAELVAVAEPEADAELPAPGPLPGAEAKLANLGPWDTPLPTSPVRHDWPPNCPDSASLLPLEDEMPCRGRGSMGQGASKGHVEAVVLPHTS